MRTSIEDFSGTDEKEDAKEDEGADASEEIQVCDICGDAGCDDELAICSRCNDSAEHIYCMATMHDSVPLQWVCEGCELEDKRGSEKKRLAFSEPLPTQACKKRNISCSAMNEVKNFPSVQKPSLKAVSFESRTGIPSVLLNGLAENIEPNLSSPSKILFIGQVACSTVRIDKRVSGVKTQAHEEPNMSKILSNSFEAKLAGEACLSTPRQGGEAPKAKVLSSPVLWGPSGSLKAAASGKKNIRQAPEMRVARESASKVNVPKAQCPADEPFLVSKRVFSRSVSMRSDDDSPSFLLPSRLKNLTRTKSAVVRPSAGWVSDLSNKSSYRGHDNELRAAPKDAMRGASCMTGGTKSMSTGLRPYRQAGQDSTKIERSSTDLESLQPWRRSIDFGKETHIRSPRNSDSLQHWGWDGRETRRCYKCDELGHIAARCKNLNSSRPREWGGSRSPACSERPMAGKKSAPESPWNFHSREEEDSFKECSMWKSHADCSEPSSNTSNQTEVYGNERTGLKHSPKPLENGLVHEKQVAEVQAKANVAASSSPSTSFKKGKQYSVEGSGMPQQAHGDDPMIIKHLQEPQPNQVILPNPWNKCHNVGPEAGTVVSTSFESHCEIQAEPCVEILWSGCFNVSSNSCLNVYNGLQAHPSSKGDPRVFEAVKTLPFELDVKELKRGLETDTWPRSLQEQPLTSNRIGVYFFPVDMECHDIWYKPLLDHLSANDLALKTSLEFFQLLIFPSQLLPEAEQYWDDRQYLWGVLENSTISHSEAP